MVQKAPRPAAPRDGANRAAGLESLGGCSDPQGNSIHRAQQSREPIVPKVVARIVIRRKSRRRSGGVSQFVEECPHCGGSHWHGAPDYTRSPFAITCHCNGVDPYELVLSPEPPLSETAAWRLDRPATRRRR